MLGQPNNFTYPTGRRIYEQWTPAVLRGTEPVPKSLSGPDHIPGGRFAVWCDRAGAQTPEQVAAGIKTPLQAPSQKLWNPGKPALNWEEFKKLGAPQAENVRRRPGSPPPTGETPIALENGRTTPGAGPYSYQRSRSPFCYVVNLRGR